MDLVIGIDIGGTKTKIGLVDEQGVCHEQTFFRTKDFPNFEEYLNKIKSTSDELLDQLGQDANVIGCGIGAPNASSKNGTIENASNLLWKGTVPLIEKLKKRMPMPMRHSPLNNKLNNFCAPAATRPGRRPPSSARSPRGGAGSRPSAR